MEENLKEMSEVDVSSLEWKGMKELDENGKYKQSSKKLVDMTASELGTCYDHCKTMLFNNESQNPGRYLVLELIKDQKDRCGVELFLRYITLEHGLSRFNLLNMITTFLANNKQIFKDKKAILKDMFDKIPNQYENLPLDLIVDGCLDKLGCFNKKHITRTFVLKQGVWLTPSEVKELFEEELMMDRRDRIRLELRLKEVEKLNINSKGINLTQMKALLNLKTNKKYSDLTTIQLETLRNRLLFSLENDVQKHIESWEKRMSDIVLVAELNNIKL